MANPDLPQEILLEIFSRIPTKSVGKCRTLSKCWKTHLSTPNFVNKHLTFRKRTIQQEHLALTTQGPGEQLFIITSPTKNDEILDKKSFPDEYYFVSGSCNGLLLLNGNRKLLLVNPITLKQVTIQKCSRPDSGHFVSVNYGLGYDSCSDDYKIVQLRSNENTTLVDVYSVKNGVWKSLDDGCYPYGGLVPKKYYFEGGAFVNGALHWLICRKDEGWSKEHYRSCIAAFDLATGVFSEVPLPKEFDRQPGNDFECFSNLRDNMPRTNGVCVVGGCLMIVDNLGNGVTEVWMMKEYGVADSWVKFRIQAEIGNWHSIVAMLCYVDEGELLFLTSWDYLFAVDLKNGTMRKVVLSGCDAWFSHGMAFVDSLVCPVGSTVARVY